MLIRRQHTKRLLFSTMCFFLSLCSVLPTRMSFGQSSSSTLIELLNSLYERSQDEDRMLLTIYLREPIYFGENYILFVSINDSLTVLSLAAEDYFCVARRIGESASRFCTNTSEIAYIAYSFELRSPSDTFSPLQRGNSTFEDLLWETNNTLTRIRRRDDEYVTTFQLRYPQGHQLTLDHPLLPRASLSVGQNYFCITRSSVVTATYDRICIPNGNLLSITQAAPYYFFPEFPAIPPNG